MKRVLTVCKSSAGDSGKKARRLIAEALEMPFHTSLISRRVREPVKNVLADFVR